MEPQEKKKTPKGRAKKRITYTRRFVNVTMTGGKRKVSHILYIYPFAMLVLGLGICNELYLTHKAGYEAVESCRCGLGMERGSGPGSAFRESIGTSRERRTPGARISQSNDMAPLLFLEGSLHSHGFTLK